MGIFIGQTFIFNVKIILYNYLALMNMEISSSKSQKRVVIDKHIMNDKI